MWSCFLYTGAKCWVSQTAFPNPGRVTLVQDLISTAVKEKLLDGTFGYTQPEGTWTSGPIRLAWPKREKTTLQTRLENYIKSGSGLKITAHTGKEFIGKITRLLSEWSFTGAIATQSQRYWLEIEFELYEEDALRDQQW